MHRLTVAALIASALPAAASAQTPGWHLDIRNKSDACAWITVAEKIPASSKNFVLYRGGVLPGKDIKTSGEFVNRSLTVSAEVWRKPCSGAFVAYPYDRIPGSGNSELSIHKQGSSTYIMRQGP